MNEVDAGLGGGGGGGGGPGEEEEKEVFMIPIACLSPSGYSSLLLDYPLKTYSRRANHVQRRLPNR